MNLQGDETEMRFRQMTDIYSTGCEVVERWPKNQPHLDKIFFQEKCKVHKETSQK